MEELDITELLSTLEDGYDIIKSNILDKQLDFLAMGDDVFGMNEVPEIDIPITLGDYIALLKE